MYECVLLHRANDMLTVLDALIPILLTNIVTDRKLEIKDIRELAQTCPSHYLQGRSQHNSGLNCGFSTQYGFNFFRTTYWV
jgi:glycyl-tRNA synthetase alpha subunit